MCGINGLLSFKKEAENRAAKVAECNQKLSLRGPDAQGSYSDGPVTLGHCRLSIIDVSTAAGQPMADSTGRYVIAFNGEIYNYRQLRDTYLSGVEMRTSSDTEVLLRLLIAHGPDCLSWLDGFFAFAFWDKENGEMLLARDRYGKKPLLYYASDDYFAFASEMKSLLEWGIPRKLNKTVLHQYLQLNYVPQPQSMLEGVAKLRPGHYMRVNASGKFGEEVAWYTLRTHPESYGEHTYESAQAKLRVLMDEAVEKRMISDVPLGAFLSGGIDSSVVVALASRHTDRLRTFSIGYRDEPFFDETKYAQMVAKKYNTDHTVFSLANDDFLEHLYDVLDYIDEPFADSSALPVYILSRHTKKEVTVALSGDGGDEVFAGYNKHAAEYRVRRKSLLNNVVKAGLPLWNALPRGRSGKLTNTVRQLHRFAEGARLSPQERYWRWASLATPAEVEEMLAPGNAADTVEMAKLKASLLAGLKTDDYNEVLLTDMNLVLLSDMLVKVDLMSMAASLEVRSPFLDHHVVDFAFGLPAAYKIDGQMKKRIVQDAFRADLPEEIYNRPKKGFEIPLLGWFRKELWPLINDDLLQKDFVAAQGIFNPDATEALKAKLRSNNPEDSHATIWALIVFQYWWKKYLA